IGRYQGLVTLDLEDGKAEFLLLEYEGGDKLYVPVSQLGMIGRYSGAQPEEAPLHKLGSGQWDKAKARAAKQVRDTAAELLALYAKRASRHGHAFGIRQHDLEAFAAGFGFEETPDQAAAIEAVVGDMAVGKPMDRLVCGTHKLLGRDVKLPRVGLVIIDEEHRFGVRQKEALKRLRADVDVLTLTATPIPRTLAMSLEGIRDFSVIATAPEKRLAIKTFVAPFSEGLIREAVLRELKRGGQAYFLHNEVESIERMRERLQRLLPEARIAVAHGQMP